MSVHTTADERLDSARESVADALKALHDIVIDECWGHDEWGSGFRDRMEQAYQDLLGVRRLLQGKSAKPGSSDD